MIINVIDYLLVGWRHETVEVVRFLISSGPIYLLTIKVINEVVVVLVYALLVVDRLIEFVNVVKCSLIWSLGKRLLVIFTVILAPMFFNWTWSFRLNWTFYLCFGRHWDNCFLIISLLALLLLLNLDFFNHLLLIFLLHFGFLLLILLLFRGLFLESVFEFINITGEVFELFGDVTIFTIGRSLVLLSRLLHLLLLNLFLFAPHFHDNLLVF